MARKTLVIISAIVLVALIVSGCAAGSKASTGAAPTPGGTPARARASGVSAEAFVMPVRHADLAFKNGGRVSEVSVKEGDKVQAGQQLVRLDDSSQQAAVAQAEASLAHQAELANTKAGPTPEKIAQAVADVAKAQATLQEAKAGPTSEAVNVAQAHVNMLRAQLASRQAGPRPEAIEASNSTVLQAEAAVKQAQADYDRVKGNGEVTVREPAALALQNATLNFQAVRANHQALLNGATPQEIAVLQAQVAEGESQLKQARANATPERIAQAEAVVESAQAALAQIKAGATKEQIAVSEAAVKEAAAGLEQAKTTLADAQISAPFDGTVANFSVEPGQFVAPATPVITIADTSAWQLETDNLTEIEIVRVTEGQNVTYTVDAIPGESFEGKVIRVKPQSEKKAGDVTYTVVVGLEKPDPRLRWGMTTAVQFPSGD